MKILIKRIFKAQIILDRLKEATKIGQKNINKLRNDLRLMKLKERGFT